MQSSKYLVLLAAVLSLAAAVSAVYKALPGEDDWSCRRFNNKERQHCYACCVLKSRKNNFAQWYTSKIEAWYDGKICCCIENNTSVHPDKVQIELFESWGVDPEEPPEEAQETVVQESSGDKRINY
jgi:hypothetical protein